MLYSIIIASCLDGGIGYDTTIPWHIKEEMKLFRRITTGNIDLSKINVVIMGRNTWNSLPNKPLQNRLNIVITNDEDFPKYDNLISFNNLDDAFSYCEMNVNIRNVFVIGGKKFYETCLYNEKYSKNIEKIFLSVIYKNHESNVFIDLKYILNNYYPNINSVRFNSQFLHLEMKRKNNYEYLPFLEKQSFISS